MGSFFSSRRKRKQSKQQQQQQQQQQQASNPNNQVTDKDRALLELRRQKDRLHQYSKQVQIVIERETLAARQYIRDGNKLRARLFLKKRRYQEKQLTEAEQHMYNIEKLCSSIEYATVQQQVIAALKHGTTTLNQINAETSLDDIDTLMSDTKDAIDYQEEVSDRLSQALTSVDQQEIENEIEIMEAEINPVPTAATAAAAVNTPTPATTITPAQTQPSTAQREAPAIPVKPTSTVIPVVTSNGTVDNDTDREDSELNRQLNDLPVAPVNRPIDRARALERIVSMTQYTDAETIHQTNADIINQDKAKLYRRASREMELVES